MSRADSQTDAPVASIFDARFSPMYHPDIVSDERDWRVPDEVSAMASSASKIIATRWRCGEERAQEWGTETPANCHVVKSVLRGMNIHFRVSGRTVQDGLATPGPIYVPEQAAPVGC